MLAFITPDITARSFIWQITALRLNHKPRVGYIRLNEITLQKVLTRETDHGHCPLRRGRWQLRWQRNELLQNLIRKSAGSRELTGSRVNRKKSIYLNRWRTGKERKSGKSALHSFLETGIEVAIPCKEILGERAASLTSPTPLPSNGTLEKDSQ